MEKARRLAEKQHCVDFRVFDNQMATPKEQVVAADAEDQQQQEALVRIEMRKLNDFIKKLLCQWLLRAKVQQVGMYETFILLT